MRKIAVCLLAAVLASFGLSLSASHVAVHRVSSPAYLADGGGPTPPPIPMGTAKSAVTYMADGGGPTPPPIPMNPLEIAAETRYLADGGGPTPPPIPMGAHGNTTEPVYSADGGGPTPPPIPMGGGNIAAC